MPLDDLVVNTRQILQYPTSAEAETTDAFLFQRGGLGGAYMVTSAYGIVQGAVAENGLAIGGDLVVAGSTVLDGALTVGGFTTLNGDLFVQGAASGFVNGISTGGDIFTSANLGVQGSVTFGGPLVGNVANLNTVAPVNPVVGTFWFDDNFKQLFVLDSSGSWTIAVNPPGMAPLDSPMFIGTPTINGVAIATMNDVTLDISGMEDVIENLVQQWLAQADAAEQSWVEANFMTLTQVQALGYATTTWVQSHVSSALNGFTTTHSAALQTWLNAATLPTWMSAYTPTSGLQTWLNSASNIVRSINGNSGVITGIATTTELNLKANIASPGLTGVPTAPTAAVTTNTQQIATTAFVNNRGNHYGPNPPSPTFTGQGWLNSTTDEFSVYNGSIWVPVGQVQPSHENRWDELGADWDEIGAVWDA